MLKKRPMGMSMKKYRLAILSSHPIQYQAPLFRKLAAHPKLDLTVYFCWDFGVEKEQLDPGFGVKLKWDIPLLEGYRYKFLANLSPKPASNFWGQVNPVIIKELSKNRYDAILIHGYTTLSAWFAFLGAWLTSIPIIFRGETDLSTPRSFLKRITKKAILVPLFRKISAFLYSYKGNAEYYKHYKVSENKLFFCPCAVDNSFWQSQALELRDKKNELKKKFGIPEGYSVILYVAKLIPRKRPMDLLQAYEVLCNLQIKASLIFVGDGPEAANLKTYTLKKNLKNVAFTEFKNQSELPALYSIADVFVLPSNHDPSPKSLNEAMNFSLPIITTNKVGTAPDLVKTGENGYIYPVGDIKALADCLLKVLEDPKTTEEMGKRSLAIVSGWSLEEDVNGILRALEYVTN